MPKQHVKLCDPSYTSDAVHADLERGHFAGFYGGSNGPYHAIAEAKSGTDLARFHTKRSKDEFYIESLDRHLKKPEVRARWRDIVTLDPQGLWASRPTMAGTCATMYIDELMPDLVRDEVIVKADGGINIVKCAVDYVWNIPGVAARLCLDETVLRHSIERYTQNSRIEDTQYRTFLPSIAGCTIYFFGDIDKLADKATEVAVRVHDECNGSDVFGTDICTCRPYLMFAVKGAVECAQRGGVGVVVYFRKEGRALGEVTKFRVYNARKRQVGGDTPENYFRQTESIAGVRDARFQELMPDVLLWLGIKRIDWLLSMSSEKYDAITAAGVEVMQRVSIPDSMVPAGATVEITAKVSAGYHTDEISTSAINEEITKLATIRTICMKLFEMAKLNQLVHFTLHLDQMPKAVELVYDSIQHQYPSLDIPYHSRMRHFCVDDVDLVAKLCASWPCDKLEIARRQIDLVTVSVLLDAGAGPDWKYIDENGNVRVRSEGLAIASLDMFIEGAFSSDKAFPHRVNSLGIKQLEQEDLLKAFQVSKTNPLVGAKERHGMLRRLAIALDENPEFFGLECARPGNVVDYIFREIDSNTKQVSIQVLWRAVIEGLSAVWPTTLSGVQRGDVWSYNPLKVIGKPGSDLVPFHKLSQWLLLSLLEPLEQLGVRFTEMNLCTGLAEYRNGGLFVDTGVLVPRDPEHYDTKFDVGSELVIEWRALTICLLDLCAEGVRKLLGKTQEELPLAQVLEGGTWRAGRLLAFAKRSDGSPPIHIRSDGTVF